MANMLHGYIAIEVQQNLAVTILILACTLVEYLDRAEK